MSNTIAADNERLRRIMNDRRTLGLEVMAATLALGSPSLSAEQVLETVARTAKAAGINRTAGLSAAVDQMIARDGSTSSSQPQGGLSGAVDEVIGTR
ncbi:hypothetical protein AAII07_56910 [Microvirga sp. 0TCS3.31]